MSVQTPTLNIRQFLNNHLVDVFDTMLSMKAIPLAEGKAHPCAERVTGSVGIGGETVTGAVYIHVSAEFASQITAAMLGLPPEEKPAAADVNDVMGECANMLTGGLKSALCDAGAPCAVSTPCIIRGASYHIEPMPDVQHESLLFDCNGNSITVEVHIKYS